MLKDHYVQCTCHSPEHLIIFRKFEDADPGDEDSFYISVQLHQWQSFWKRCWIAIKYVMGYNSRYGHWDSISVSQRDAESLKNFLESTKNS